MSDRVADLIAAGLDRDAAALAVREALDPETKEGAVGLGPVEQLEVIIPLFGGVAERAPLDAPTPCEGWTVRDVLGHMNSGARLFTAAFTGSPPSERSMHDDPLGTVTEALAQFLAAVRAPGALDQRVNSPFGSMPGEQFARLAAVDGLVHLWDVAVASGQELAVSDDVVSAADKFARMAITDDMRQPGLFGLAVEPAPGASSLDVLAAFTGRRRE